MRTLSLVLLLAIGCGGNKDEAPAGPAKATPDQCKAAYAHLADLQVKKNGGTADEWLKTQQGNIESCPRMTTTKGIDCLNAITEWDMMKVADCSKVK